MRSIVVKILKVTALIFISLYCLIWLFSPLAVRYYAPDVLKDISDNKLQLTSESSVRYNPFLSHLSIYDLTLNGEKTGTVFSIKELQLEINLYELLMDQVKISEFIINDLYVKIDINDKNLDIAGFTIADETPDKTTSIEPEKQKGAFAYIIKLPKFQLNNAKIEINIKNSKQIFDINQMTVLGVSASEKNQIFDIDLNSTVNEAPLNIKLVGELNNGHGAINLKTTLEQLDLSSFSHFLPDSISSLTGKVNFSGTKVITLNEQAISIDVKALKLGTEQLEIEQNQQIISFNTQSVTSDNLDIKLNPTGEFQTKGTVGIHVTDFNLNVFNKEQLLAHIDSLSVPELVFDVSDHTQALEVSTLVLTKAIFSDAIKDEVPALAQFDELKITEIKLTEEMLKIAKITLAGLKADAKLNKNKELSNLVSLPKAPENKPETQTEKAATTEASNVKNAFHIALGEFKLTDNAEIHFTDNSIEPTFESNVVISTLSMGEINNQKAEIKTPIELIGTNEEYAKFKFSGVIQPFLAKPVYQVKGYFNEIDLPMVSTYMKESLHYVFDSGQLNINIDTKITGSEIDGDMNILMRGVELTAAEDQEANSIKDQTAIPFSMALGMLKDGDGNIELDLPLAGDTSSPSFGFSGFITLIVKQATMSAAKDYLMTTFVPYANVVSVAMTAGEFILKVRFNDLEFSPTTTALTPEHDEFLKQFSALMKDKPDQHITLCAIATAADLNKPSGTQITDKAEISQLKEISLKRMHNFKQYMINEAQLESSRLLLCTPQIDSAITAKPRITFSS